MTDAPVVRRPAREAQVVFDGVSKSFRMRGETNVWTLAVDDVSLTIGPGESVGIIGPNGAGKSTLLRLATGVSAPSKGTISRRGRCCAVIELGAGIHPDLTGRENVFLLAALFGMDDRSIRKRFDEVIHFADLEAVVDRPVRTYSTGMVARLAFAVASHSEPDLLLLDEVLSVGDLDFQRRCQDRIAELRRDGITVVLVSHDLELVGDVCERAVLLVDGAVALDGRASTVIRRYIGLPEPPVPDDRLRVRVPEPAITSGAPVLAALTHKPPAGAHGLRVDLVVRHHPSFLLLGEDLSVVFASALLPVPSEEEIQIEVPTAGIPPGRYELRCAFETIGGDTLIAEEVPIRILGPRGPFAFSLDAQATFDPLPDIDRLTLRP